MLPNHAPLVIAEQFGMLEALHPGRIDLGIGRAPGTDQLTAAALRRGDRRSARARLARAARRAPRLLRRPFPDDHPYRRITAVPALGYQPELWLLGSSDYSAQLAGLLGLPFSFAHHFAAGNTDAALAVYRTRSGRRPMLDEPYVMLGVAVTCAETERAGPVAREARRPRLPAPAGRAGRVASRRPRRRPAFHPTPTEKRGDQGVVVVADRRRPGDGARPSSTRCVERTGADELMVTTMAHGHDDRVRSYELLAELAGLTAASRRAPRHTGSMPEGDTLAKTAARLRPALAGHVLTRFEAPRLRGDAPALGTQVERVEARASTCWCTSPAA